MSLNLMKLIWGVNFALILENYDWKFKSNFGVLREKFMGLTLAYCSVTNGYSNLNICYLRKVLML